MSPRDPRRLRLEELEQKIAAGALSGAAPPFGDAAQSGPPSQPMGVNHADYSLVNDF